MRALLIIAITLFTQLALAQEANEEYIATEAIITDINFKIRSRRSSATAKVDYVTMTGDSLSSSVKLFHIPFIGPLQEKGDRITVLYSKEQPLLLSTKGSSLFQKYGLYLFIFAGVIIAAFRFIKYRSKTKSI